MCYVFDRHVPADEEDVLERARTGNVLASVQTGYFAVGVDKKRESELIILDKLTYRVNIGPELADREDLDLPAVLEVNALNGRDIFLAARA